jgi:hypothetical protein
MVLVYPALPGSSTVIAGQRSWRALSEFLLWKVGRETGLGHGKNKGLRRAWMLGARIATQRIRLEQEIPAQQSLVWDAQIEARIWGWQCGSTGSF